MENHRNMKNTILKRDSAHNEKSSVCVAIFDKEDILLTMRRDVPVWVLPGGGVERGETPEEAAIREVKEETGLNVTIIRKIATYYPANKLASLTYFFEAEIQSGTTQKTDETKDIAFFPTSALPQYLPPPYRDWIEDALQRFPQPLEKKITSVNYRTLLVYLVTHPILVCRFLLTRMGIHINSK